MFPATLFDFNGVLVDDELVHLAAFQDAVAPLGIEISQEEYFQKYLGFDDAGVFQALLTAAGKSATKAEVERLIEAKRPLYMERARRELQTFPHAAEVVRTRASFGPVGVVSGALTAEIEFGLQHLGISDLVGKIISAEDTSVSKPDPQGYRMGIDWLRADLGERVEEILVIEDSLDGIQAAKDAGLTCIAVAHSYSVEELSASLADLVVERLEQITPDLLELLYLQLFPQI